MADERWTTLSPVSAATGMVTMRAKLKLCASGAELRLDVAERRFRPVDQIHLVDCEHHILDADEIADRGMAAGLALGAVAGIDQQDRDVGVRGAGRHVAGILLVARRIDDDEAAIRRLEIAPGDVDGDALLALGLEPVEQQAEIDLLAVL